MTPEPEAESEPSALSLRNVSNKQVEIFDRLRQLEERMDRIVERIRKCEDRAAALEATMARKPGRP